MECEKCVNWNCEDLSYTELLVRWEESIGGIITPGFIQRYEREAEILEIPVRDVRIGYKYCSVGMLTRFYLRKGHSDTRPVKEIRGCPKYTETHNDISALWRICTEETHGISEVEGIKFAPGLFENQTYMRVPLFGSMRPVICNDGDKCSICGERSKRALKIRFERSFCCNKHYLEWWAGIFQKDMKMLEAM